MTTCANCAHGDAEHCKQADLGLSPGWPRKCGFLVVVNHAAKTRIETCPRWRAEGERDGKA